MFWHLSCPLFTPFFPFFAKRRSERILLNQSPGMKCVPLMLLYHRYVRMHFPCHTHLSNTAPPAPFSQVHATVTQVNKPPFFWQPRLLTTPPTKQTCANSLLCEKLFPLPQITTYPTPFSNLIYLFHPPPPSLFPATHPHRPLNASYCAPSTANTLPCLKFAGNPPRKLATHPLLLAGFPLSYGL